MHSRNFEIDMVHGPIMQGLVSFFIPLLISGWLQLLFNAMDLIVVGRFTGSEALAAVGATTSLINVFINLFMGVSLGANVLVARYIACGNNDNVSRTVHTSILFALVSGIFMIFVGFFFSSPALKLMGTPDEVLSLSTLYMRIYFVGMPFFMVYNYGAAILRATGDTRRPLLFLLIAGVLNVILNLLLVIVFHLGVAGVAIATVFSQMVSCVLVITCLCSTAGVYRLSLNKLKIDADVLVRVLRIGLPAGAQMTVINFSNVLLQSSVNSFGALAMAGYTACANIMSFFYTAVNSVTQACMTFTSQNYGAGNPVRMKKVLWSSLLLETFLGVGLGISGYLCGESLLSVYNSSADVIAYGMQVAVITYPTYVLCAYMDCLPGALRGMGHSAIPMVLSVLGTVGTRVVWIFLLFPWNRTLTFLFISYPVSWILTFFMQAVCLTFVSRKIYRSMALNQATV